MASRRCAGCASARPRSRVIVLTSFLDDERLMPAIEAGAAGYLLKDVAPAQLAQAIRAAHAGETMIAPTVATRLVQAIAQRAATRPSARGPSASS